MVRMLSERDKIMCLHSVLPESPWKKGKWSTEGWEGVCSSSWGQPKEDSGPPDSPSSKGKWSTKGWGKESSSNWGQSKGDGTPRLVYQRLGKSIFIELGTVKKGDGVPPDSFWTKRKRSDETAGGTSSTQRLGKPDTKSWHKKKHNNKYAT
ncbi:hypothetical protein FXO37_16497 [Capsicum annuum]|nr:hypothetical protein FXO37_16497 [Capsicum annuum]